MQTLREDLWHLLVSISFRLQGLKGYSGFGQTGRGQLVIQGPENALLDLDYKWRFYVIAMLYEPVLPNTRQHGHLTVHEACDLQIRIGRERLSELINEAVNDKLKRRAS